MRRGFHGFFREIREAAQKFRIGFHLVAGGSRDKAVDLFCTAVRHQSESLCLLLIDSEGEPPGSVFECVPNASILKQLGVSDDSCHLMVQTMEAWFFADLDCLQRYYGREFKRGALPSSIEDVELIPKDKLIPMLEEATSNTKKGRYHKINHAPDLLDQIDVAKVRNASKYCRRLFSVVANIGEP